MYFVDTGDCAANILLEFIYQGTGDCKLKIT